MRIGTEINFNSEDISDLKANLKLYKGKSPKKMYPDHMANLDHNILNLQNRIESPHIPNSNYNYKKDKLFITSPISNILDFKRINLTNCEPSVTKFNKKSDPLNNPRKYSNYHRESELQLIMQEEKSKLKNQLQSIIKESTKNQSVTIKDITKTNNQNEIQIKEKISVSKKQFESIYRTPINSGTDFSSLDTNKRANSFILPTTPNKLINEARTSYYKTRQENALYQELKRREDILNTHLTNENYNNLKIDSSSLKFVF